MGDERMPYAVSTRRPVPEADRAESFDLEGAESPDEFRLARRDEEARRGRLQESGVAEAERAELVAQALDGIARWAAVPGAADAIIRELGARLHVGPGEAAELVEAERARQAAREGRAARG